LAIIYKDRNVITSLKEFSKNLSKLQKAINLYHQILKSSSPPDVEILEIQNGSIDIIVNLDIDIALNLIDLFKIGFKCYIAYLSYKNMIRPIVDTYFGNKKLESGEIEREKDLLENIGESIKREIKKQHEKALQTDKSIDTNIDKKVEQVSNLITSHIINGNNIKILALSYDEEKNEDKDRNKENITELRILTANAHNELKKLPDIELIKLLEYYTKSNNDENSNKE
jgi:hypothetical protein